MWPVAPERRVITAQEAAEGAVAAIGCGYDLASDLRLSYCKSERLVDVDRTGEARSRDIEISRGIVVSNVPNSIRWDKGERTRFRSDVLSFHQMSEHFNKDLCISGKIPSGLFNAMFDFCGCWQKDASATKSLAFDGWFITLYSIELARSNFVLLERVKQDVPSCWNPVALAEFIEKYGTHIVVGVKMGGKDVIYIKQQKESSLQQTEVLAYLKNLAEERFSDNPSSDLMLQACSTPRRKGISVEGNKALAILKPVRSSVIFYSKKDDIECVHVRRGGINTFQSHGHWLPTVVQAPSVISMSFLPITSLLTGVQGSGFLSHAVNSYLRYKPPIEELAQFLAFQLPRRWAPAFGELPLGPHRRKHALPCLQFSFMGPRLHVSTEQVSSGNRPVTGLRLYLEGEKNDCLAIHVQHLSSFPRAMQPFDEAENPLAADDLPATEKSYYEPIKWGLLSHVCTAPVQCTAACLDDSASIVTRAWLEVMETGVKRVLFIRLGFSGVSSMKVRRSEWDGPDIGPTTSKSVSISALFSTHFSSGSRVLKKTKPKVEVNSGVFPGGPPVPIRVPKLSRFVNTAEMTRGPDDLPGYWVVTGAKLCVDCGKVSLKVKYSLLTVVKNDEL